MPKMKPFLEWMISVFSCVMAAASWFHLMNGWWKYNARLRFFWKFGLFWKMAKSGFFREWMIFVCSVFFAASLGSPLTKNVEEMLCWARQDFVLLEVWQVLEQVPRMSFLEEWTSVLVCCQMAASRVSYDRKMVRKYCQARLSSLRILDSKLENAKMWFLSKSERVSSVGLLQLAGFVHDQKPALWCCFVARQGWALWCFGQKKEMPKWVFCLGQVILCGCH